MTTLIELADAYAEAESKFWLLNNGKLKQVGEPERIERNEARAALVAEIEALQAENTRLTLRAGNGYSEKIEALIAERDTLAAKLVPLTDRYNRGYMVALSDAEEAIGDECRERVVTASDCIEIIRNLGAAKGGQHE